MITDLVNWCDDEQDLVRVVTILKKLETPTEHWRNSDEILNLAVRAGASFLVLDMLQRLIFWEADLRSSKD